MDYTRLEKLLEKKAETRSGTEFEREVRDFIRLHTNQKKLMQNDKVSARLIERVVGSGNDIADKLETPELEALKDIGYVGIARIVNAYDDTNFKHESEKIVCLEHLHLKTGSLLIDIGERKGDAQYLREALGQKKKAFKLALKRDRSRAYQQMHVMAGIFNRMALMTEGEEKDKYHTMAFATNKASLKMNGFQEEVAISMASAARRLYENNKGSERGLIWLERAYKAIKYAIANLGWANLGYVHVQAEIVLKEKARNAKDKNELVSCLEDALKHAKMGASQIGASDPKGSALCRFNAGKICRQLFYLNGKDPNYMKRATAHFSAFARYATRSGDPSLKNLLLSAGYKPGSRAPKLRRRGAFWERGYSAAERRKNKVYYIHTA